MKKLLISAAVAAASLTAVSAFAGDAAVGKSKSAVCAACHMADGNSVNPLWPKLAGQHEGYIVKQLKEFKSTSRKEPIMLGQVAALTEEDMDNLAAYFSSQTLKGGEADPALIEAGRLLYTTGNAEKGLAACASCHAPNGVGNPAANFPAIAGQHTVYAEKQLKAFRDGSRANDMGAMMQDVAGKMSDDEIKAVASYIQGLH
ncbi:MAG TPA: cytochrome c4 [Gammaproteobacteria bacterium]|nr:cytochrome c4 [Gammaproteobacteria bacterium]